MNRWVVAAVLMLFPMVGCGRAQKPSQGMPRPQPRYEAARGISLPIDAKLVASEEVDEIRAFPEMRAQAQAQPSAMTQAQPSGAAEEVVHARAIDNVYQTKKGYKDAVDFLDKQINKQGLTSLSRKETQSATGWTLDLGGGRLENVIVRNTKPTTIETVAAAGTEVQMVQ